MANEQQVNLLKEISKKHTPVSAWDNMIGKTTYVDLTESDLSHLDLAHLNFEGADFTGAKMFNTNLEGANMKRCTLAYVDLRRANLASTLLNESNLSGANLSGANMVETLLRKSNLKGAMLAGVHLIKGNLENAMLQDADLRGANLKYSKFKGAVLHNANVEDANLTKAKIEPEQLKDLKNSDKAILGELKDALDDEERSDYTRSGLYVEEDYEDLFKEEDCYKILGIASDADMKEIARGYKRRVKEYHPDRVVNLGEKIQIVARREFGRIQHAYESLTTHKTVPDVAMSFNVDQGGEVRSGTHYSLDQLEALSKRFPDDHRVIFNLGNKYMEEKNYEQAAIAFKRALNLKPDNEAAKHNLQIANLLCE